MSLILIGLGLIILVGCVAAILFIARPSPDDLEDKIHAQQAKINPNAGVVKNALTRTKIESYTKAQVAANEAGRATTAAIIQKEEAALAAKKVQSDADVMFSANDAMVSTHKTTVAENEAKNEAFDLHKMMLRKAKQMGLPYGVFEKMMEKQELDALEIRRLAEEKRIVLEAGFIYQLQDYHKLGMLRGQIDALIAEIDQIQSNNNLSETAKRRQIEEREHDIQAFQQDRNKRRQRLLQAIDGENVGTGGEDTVVRERPRKAVGGTTDGVSS